MSYVASTMVSGERIISWAKFHWIYNWSAIALFVVGVVGGIFLMIPFILVPFGLVMLIKRWTTEICVTSRRVIYKHGWIARKVEELSLGRIEEINLKQGVLGRILSYGNLVCYGTGTGEIVLPVISRPLNFRKAIQEAQNRSKTGGMN